MPQPKPNYCYEKLQIARYFSLLSPHLPFGAMSSSLQRDIALVGTDITGALGGGWTVANLIFYGVGVSLKP
jgi:hypothetical protein